MRNYNFEFKKMFDVNFLCFQSYLINGLSKSFFFILFFLKLNFYVSETVSDNKSLL